MRKIMIFHHSDCKNNYFQTRKYDFLLIFAQNTDHGGTLKPPHTEMVLMSKHNLYMVQCKNKNNTFTPVNLNITL